MLSAMSESLTHGISGRDAVQEALADQVLSAVIVQAGYEAQ